MRMAKAARLPRDQRESETRLVWESLGMFASDLFGWMGTGAIPVKWNRASTKLNVDSMVEKEELNVKGSPTDSGQLINRGDWIPLTGH